MTLLTGTVTFLFADIEGRTKLTWDAIMLYASMSPKVEDLIAIAMSHLTRQLTDEECKKYLHVDVCPSIP